MFNHVDTSWKFGVLEYQHVNEWSIFNIFALRLLAQSITETAERVGLGGL